MIDTELPLTAHLEELRSRTIRALGGVAVAFGVCYTVSDRLFAFLTAPLLALREDGLTLIGTGVTEAFFTRLTVSLIAAVFLASPVIFYQLWRFIAPGLHDKERRLAVPFVAAATTFFLLGGAFCYVVVFPVAYAFFLQEYEAIGVAPTIRIREYLSFASRMLFAFGVTFELPVMTFFLARLGMITHHTLTGWFRYAVVGIFVLAAILTPDPDIASQFLMAGPLLILYVLSIGVAYVVAQPPASSADDS